MNLKIVKTENKEVEKRIKEGLKNSGGHCPCVIPEFWNEDTKCLCKEFREQDTVGYCHCGLYRKVEV